MTTTNNPTGTPVFPLKSAAHQQYNRVQNLLIGAMLLMTLQVQAQTCVNIFKPIFFDNKILSQLKDEKLVDDIVELDGKLLYLKIKTSQGSLEYFQLDDSTFYSREKVADQYTNKGKYRRKINLARTVPDTLITFDPETYEETCSLLYVCPMRKIEFWNEVDELGRTWMGNYSDVHERMGNWMLALIKEPYYRVYRFENGKIIGIWSPDKEDIEANIAWLCQEKKICISRDQRGIWVLDNSRGACEENALVFDREHQMKFYASPSKAKVETTTITIAVDDEMSGNGEHYRDIPPEEYENIFQGRKAGGGKWNLNDKNEFEITFGDGYVMRFTIDYFSENLIGLKYIK